MATKSKILSNINLTSKPILWLLLLTFFHGLWYASINHPWQAPDEFLHYEYLRILETERRFDLSADDRSSVVQKEIAESMWQFQHYRYRYIATPSEAEFRDSDFPLGKEVFTPQPPLYYLLSIPIYWFIQSLPVLSQLYFLRIFSVLLQSLTVLLTYKLACEIFDTNKSNIISLTAAFFVALLPQYTFISSSFNNDNLAAPLVTASLLFSTRALKRQGSPKWLGFALIAGGLSLLAKRTAVAIIPVLLLIALTSAIIWLKSKSVLKRTSGISVILLVGFSILLLFWLILAAPQLPYSIARPLRLSSGALSALSSFWKDPIKLGNVDWSWWFGQTFESFWGRFGWFNVFVAPNVMKFLLWFSVLPAVGIVIGIARRVKTQKSRTFWFKTFTLTLFCLGIVITILSMIAQYLIAPEWYSPQGRYLFPFISVFGILFAIGWMNLFPSKYQKFSFAIPIIILLMVDTISWMTILRFFYS